MVSKHKIDPLPVSIESGEKVDSAQRFDSSLERI